MNYVVSDKWYLFLPFSTYIKDYNMIASHSCIVDLRRDNSSSTPPSLFFTFIELNHALAILFGEGTDILLFKLKSLPLWKKCITIY